MKQKTKVMLLWTRKGCRKPKMEGTATAVCSAADIFHWRKYAREGKGRFWIVEARTAAEARYLIAGYLKDQEKFGISMVTDNGKTVALGTRAVLAIGGAQEACDNWDARIRQHGIVPIKNTRALTGDDGADMLRGMRLDKLFGG